LIQRRLNLRRRAVDFVREDQIVKQRPLAELERTVLWPVDIGAGQIRRQQVGRELQPVKIALDTLGQHLDRARLCQPGRPLHQQVAVAQQRNQHPVDQVNAPRVKTACHCSGDAHSVQQLTEYLSHMEQWARFSDNDPLTTI
jgi:hypothetical protein